MDNLVIVSSMELLQMGIRQLLDKHSDRRVHGVCNSMEQLHAHAADHQVDIVVVADPVVDLSKARLRPLLVRFPWLKIILVARLHAVRPLLDQLDYCPQGIVTAESPASCLADAIRTVDAGKAYVSVEMLALLCRGIAGKHVPEKCDAMTEREVEVYTSIAAGKKNREIGTELGISEKTVSTHKARLMKKLGVSSVAKLIQFALHDESKPGTQAVRMIEK